MAFTYSRSPLISKRQAASGGKGSTVFGHRACAVLPEYASTYPYSDDGCLPGDPEGLLDPFTSLTFAAAH